MYVSEIFGPTVQGEGSHMGHAVIFVRLQGCPLRCKWCDTPYAQKRAGGVAMTAAEIVQEVVGRVRNTSVEVVLSGGEPTLQNCEDLVRLLGRYGFAVGMESAAWSCPDWVHMLDNVTLSPKPPSAGTATAMPKLAPYFDRNMPPVTLKVVVDDNLDLSYAQAVALKYGRVYVQPCFRNEDWSLTKYFKKMRWLVSEIQRLEWWSLIPRPQLHRCLYGNKRAV